MQTPSIPDRFVPDLAPGSRVVVAMSGGVDSSVAAALCQAEGFETIGITLQLYDHGQAVQRKGACCAGADIHDARNVAARLDIPHYVLDYESRFRQSVMDEFADSYLKGETPVPCIQCNQQVKFKDLLSTAKELGAAALVTGHYVRRKAADGGRAELHRAADAGRDQSYFLFRTLQAELDFLRFPLGILENKDQTRALAAQYGLAVADKPDSQDICFVPNGRYADVIRRLRPGADTPGDIVDLSGRVLGRHKGIIDFTIGQRRGLGLGGAVPYYVVKLDPDTHRVVVGPQSALAIQTVTLDRVNWLSPEPLDTAGVAADVKLRSTRPAEPAMLYAIPGKPGAAKVVLGEPAYGIAPGQACVAYRGSQVLGGGWIRQTEAVQPDIAGNIEQQRAVG